MITPAVRSLFGRSFSDHKISSTRSESHISLLEPLIIPKRSLSSATLYTNDEQVSEVTSTNDLNKEEPTLTATVPRLSIENNVYKPFVLLHCIDALIKRSKEVGLMRCGRCPKTFSVYKKLEKHLKIHDRPIERLYSCNVSDCSEVFSTKCKLMTHERSHRRCKTCKKKMNLAIADFQWHESMCRGLLFNESSGRVTRSKSICIRNEENHEYDQILYKTRIELWQRADASECDIDPEEQNLTLTDRRGSRKLNKNRRNSRSASVYQENQSPVIDDMSENEDFDSCFDRKSVISKVSKVSKVSKTSKASMYSQTSTKSKPISISIRSNYGIITRNDVLCKFPEAELVKFHEFFKKKQKRTRSLSINLAKIELELECRANRRSVQCDGGETGDEISMQTRKRMSKFIEGIYYLI